MNFGFIASKAQKSFASLDTCARQRGHRVEHVPLGDIPLSYDSICNFVDTCRSKFDALHYYAGVADPIGFYFGKRCADMDIPLLNNRARISGLIHNKLYQLLTFSAAGLPVPHSEFSGDPDWSNLSQKLNSPFIAKRARGTHGTHVYKITSQQDLDRITDPSSYLFQEFLPHTNDVRVLVLHGKAVCGYQRVPADGDFRANLARGGYVKALADKAEQETVFPLAERAAAAVGLDLAGVDLIKNANDGYYLIEININPSWYGLSDVTDTQFEDVLLDEYEKMAVNRKNT